jgi:transaldolase
VELHSPQAEPRPPRVGARGGPSAISKISAKFAWPALVERFEQEPLRATRSDTHLKIDIYADGANLEEFLEAYRGGFVRGFTTNPTLMRKAGVSDYEAFAKSVLAEIRDLPISFEVFADDFPNMERQARLISSWGRNVFVKIPVTNTKGESSVPLVRTLVAADVKLNVTALLTIEQVEQVASALSPAVPAIVSVFAGRIADTGRDPVPMMRRAVEMIRGNPNGRLLWASPREVLNIYQAEECGCHVITVTKALLDKLLMRGMDLDQLSRDTVKMFYSDACAAGYSIG